MTVAVVALAGVALAGCSDGVRIVLCPTSAAVYPYIHEGDRIRPREVVDRGQCIEWAR